MGELLLEVDHSIKSAWKSGVKNSPNKVGKAPKLYIMAMWINMIGPGGSNSVHKHDKSMFAGAYYVNAPAELLGKLAGGSGGEGFEGCIKFRDPRPQTSILEGNEWLGFGSDVTVPPAPGRMLLWPGWLDHYVEPLPTLTADTCASADESQRFEKAPESFRIVVSFNVGIRS